MPQPHAISVATTGTQTTTSGQTLTDQPLDTSKTDIDPSHRSPPLQHVPSKQISPDSSSSAPPPLKPDQSFSSFEPNFPVGQTVDDLLMSILGVAPMAKPPLSVVPEQASAALPSDPESLPPPEIAPPIPPRPFIESKPLDLDPLRPRAWKVRDATFAEAAAATVAATSLDPRGQSSSSSSTNPPTFSQESVSPSGVRLALRQLPIAAPAPNSYGRGIRTVAPPKAVNGTCTVPPRGAMSSAIAEGMASRSDQKYTAIVGGPKDKLRKKGFVQQLLELVHVSL